MNEKETLAINEEEANTDDKKRNILLKLMGCTGLSIVDSFRLGKPGGEKPRPIKVTFSSSGGASTVLYMISGLWNPSCGGANIHPL